MNIGGVTNSLKYYRVPQVETNRNQLSFAALVKVEDSRRTEMLQSIDQKIKSGGRLTEAERTYLIRYMPDVYEVIFSKSS